MAILQQQELNKIKSAIPDLQCFIVGSRTIENVKSNDVDVLVLVESPLSKEETKSMRRTFYAICPKGEYSLVFNWAKDNTRLKELFPYYDLKTDDHKYVDRDKMTFEEYDILKMRLYNTRFKAKRFYKENADGRD